MSDYNIFFTYYSPACACIHKTVITQTKIVEQKLSNLQNVGIEFILLLLDFVHYIIILLYSYRLFFYLKWNKCCSPDPNIYTQTKHIGTKANNVNCRFNNAGNDVIATSAYSFMYKMDTFVTINSVVPWLFFVIIVVALFSFLWLPFLMRKH